MRVAKIKIKNYKIFENFSMLFNDDLNIVVGNNESGKSTLLEAISLALTAQLSGRNIQYELSPYLFNITSVKNYVKSLQTNPETELPEIIIEVFLKEDFEGELAEYRGTNNSERKDSPGVCLRIEFNSDYSEEYKEYIKDPLEVKTVPVEYYSYTWFSFANNTFKFSQLPSKIMLLDRSDNKMQNGSDKYIAKIIDDTLEKSENASLSLLCRKQKEVFSNHQSMKKINEQLFANKSQITDHELFVSVDISSRTNWDSNLTLYIDDVPFRYIGKGEQGSIKTKLALKTKKDKSHLIMIEEPETNLSYSNLNKLISGLIRECSSRQLIITTHSTFLMNKIGIDKLKFLTASDAIDMSDISEDTSNFFKKLPGYDTLRMIIAKRSILVEGSSDELIVQKAYYQIHEKLPLDDEIDVISVGGVTFGRFMEIASKLEKPISVITDNDGDYKTRLERFKEYTKFPNIKLFADEDTNYPTLEPQLLKANGLHKLNELLGKKFKTELEIITYMKNNKTDCALKIFEGEKVEIPGYILNAIK